MTKPAIQDLELATFVRESIASGRFTDESEMLEAGLRRLQDDDIKLKKLRDAIEDGLRSGEPKELDSDAFLAKMRLRYASPR